MNTPFFRRSCGCLFAIAFLCAFPLAAEEAENDRDSWQIETSLWMIANFLPEPGDFYQLSLGYKLDEKNVLFLNALTWKYPAPLGNPEGQSFEALPADESYPGYVRAFGLGLAYQRFLWKGLFASLYATPFLQNFYSDDDRYMQSGFQLFLQLQVGYRFDFFKGRLYLKPAVSFNYWPVNTNFPDSFRQVEEGWPNYACFEPHLNIGFSF